jgi:hypothetical protein
MFFEVAGDFSRVDVHITGPAIVCKLGRHVPLSCRGASQIPCDISSSRSLALEYRHSQPLRSRRPALGTLLGRWSRGVRLPRERGLDGEHLRRQARSAPRARAPAPQTLCSARQSSSDCTSVTGLGCSWQTRVGALAKGRAKRESNDEEHQDNQKKISKTGKTWRRNFAIYSSRQATYENSNSLCSGCPWVANPESELACDATKRLLNGYLILSAHVYVRCSGCLGRSCLHQSQFRRVDTKLPWGCMLQVPHHEKL